MKIEEEIKQSKFTSPQQKAMVNLLYSYNWLRDRHNEALKNHDILSQHYNVLRIVKGKSPEPANPGHIKSVMLDQGRDLTRLIDKLVKMNLLERNICADNRRMVEIFITPKGEKLADEIQNELSKITKKHFKLTDTEAEQLSDLLDKMRG